MYKRYIAFFIICVGVIVCSPQLFANEEPLVSVTAEVDTDEVLIGTIVRYSVTIACPVDYEVDFPEPDILSAEFSVVDVGNSTKKWFGKNTIVHWYDVHSYVTGEHVFPAIEINYREALSVQWETVSSNNVTVRVQSLLEQEESPTDIKDIIGPKHPRFRYRTLLIVFAVVVLIGLLFAGWRYMQKHKKWVYKPAPVIPAHQIAFSELEELQQRDYVRKGKIKQYYYELTLIVRAYIENRFFIRAPEMTTDEFLLDCNARSFLTPGHKNVLREFLMHGDLVKFANYGPDDTEIAQSYDIARKFIDETKEVLLKDSDNKSGGNNP